MPLSIDSPGNKFRNQLLSDFNQGKELMSAVAPAKPASITRDRNFWLIVIAALYAALTWPVLLSGIVGPGGPAHDETNYHAVVMKQFLAQWPHPNIADYHSALAPGYYLFLAGVAQIFGDDIRLFRFITGLFAIGSVLLMQRFMTSEVAKPRNRFLITLPLLVLPITLRSGMWLVTDFPAFFFIVIAIIATLKGFHDWRNALVATLAVLTAIFCRQISAWVILPIIISLWNLKGRNRIAYAWMGAITILPGLLLLWLYQKWGGLTPPDLQTRYQHPNLCALTMTLSYLGIVTPFFIAANPEILKRLAGNWHVLALCAGAGLLTSIAWATDYNFEEGRWGGPLWSLAQHLPVMTHRSILFPPLAALGAAGLFVLWRGVMIARANATLLVVALLSMVIAQCTTHLAFERYYQPTIMLVCGWLFSWTLEPTESKSQIRPLPLILLAAGFFALSLVSEYYTLFRMHPLD
ncbi:MAG: hypothetical protein ABI579_07125 [Candidatus Sumerlaeota bacterium]